MDEIISALGKTVADMTFGADGAVRQRILDDLTREIARFEDECHHAGIRRAALRSGIRDQGSGIRHQ